MSERLGSIVIEGIEPSVDGGRFPAKRVVGEPVMVEADIFKEGHDQLAAVVLWRGGAAGGWQEKPMAPLVNDRWQASLTFDKPGRYAFTVEAWTDLYRSWAHELDRKVSAGQNVKSELLEGAALLQGCADRASKSPVQHAAADARALQAARTLIGDPATPQPEAAAAALDEKLIARASRHPDRASASRAPVELEVVVEPVRAAVGAWYEFFPRSCGPLDANGKQRHGTFKDSERMLEYAAQLGFDVVYLPPIHPIGRVARKGKNNSLQAGPEDVGSPWAIGAAEGGHKSIHPQLGTMEDFKRFVQKAKGLGIEIALDLAFQCAPDHPYIKAHPEWFLFRPDGTLKTAENPPKRYEDIVNFDYLGPARESLWTELRSVVTFWIEAGVKLFRVDNPHTKPVRFWQWLIESVRKEHPEVIFLSEAFTRPKMMKALAKVGFSQSYTYFTWRNFKGELEEYLTELTTPPVVEFMRGNFWPNTPDILPEILQQGGPPAFRIRVALAATLLPSYGIYSGYELCENAKLKGEEYLDSEKYQLRHRDFEQPGNLQSYLRALNVARREQPALLNYRALRFYPAHNDRVLFYGKITPESAGQPASRVLVAVSLDPHSPQEAVLDIPLEALGIKPDETYQVVEQLTGKRELWQGPSAFVRLTPEAPAAIWSVHRFLRSEASFDYFQ